LTQTEPQVGDWIALYGSLMRGLGAMDELGIGDRLRYVGPCVLWGELFDLGRYPGLRLGGGHVVGELHAVLELDVFERLDEFEGYAAAQPRESLYLRKKVTLIEPAGAGSWVYLYNGVPDARSRIVSWDWRAHLARGAND